MNKLKQIIYLINHRKIQLAIGLFLILISLPTLIKADELINDNQSVYFIKDNNLYIINKADNSINKTSVYNTITSSNYKFISLEDNINGLPVIGDYEYKILLDNHNGNGYKLLGYYGKDDDVFLPDNSSVIIFVPSPIKTNTSDVWTYSIKPNLYTIIGFSLTYVPYIIIVVIVLYYIQRKIRKGY